jgi:N-formylglutamate deformylase
VHCLQVELNRALYLDESRVEKHEGFARLKSDIDQLSKTLCDEARKARARFGDAR